jgi:hypothetical protein
MTERKNEEIAVPMLLENLKQRCLVPKSVGLTTVYRLLHRTGLMQANRVVEDRRKYEAAQPNDIWQSDVMHAPMLMVNNRQRKTYLIAFLDDHSRLMPFARFYLNEKLATFMQAFEKAILKHNFGFLKDPLIVNSIFLKKAASYKNTRIGVGHIVAYLAPD